MSVKEDVQDVVRRALERITKPIPEPFGELTFAIALVVSEIPWRLFK